MPKLSQNVVNSELRERIFDDLLNGAYCIHYAKVNDRQYGCILTDKNGVERYCRIGVIVAEEREDMTARDLMQSEIDAYNQKQADKAEKAKKKEAKIAKDKARREAEAKAKEEV